MKELEESFRQSVTVANYNPHVRELMEAELVFADLFFRVEAPWPKPSPRIRPRPNQVGCGCRAAGHLTPRK